MEQFLQRIEEIYNSGDPEARTWFLIRHNYLPFILCGSYVLFSTVIGPALMKNRKPFDLRLLMMIFNFSIVLTYAVSLSIIFWNLPKITFEEYCIGGIVRKGQISYTLATYCWVIYILKYVEFFDTIFFVLRKKENSITFLHVFHHTIVPLLVWMIFRTEKSGFQTVILFVNSFVHIIMYSYYGLSSMGPQMKKYLWWKKYLTQLQMVQFIFMVVFVSIITPLTGCTLQHASYVLNLVVAPVFLYLFYRFYRTSFQQQKPSPVTNGAQKKEELANGKRETETDKTSFKMD